MINLTLTKTEAKALSRMLDNQNKIAQQRLTTAQEDNTKMLYEMLLTGIENIQNKLAYELEKSEE